MEPLAVAGTGTCSWPTEVEKPRSVISVLRRYGPDWLLGQRLDRYVRRVFCRKLLVCRTRALGYHAWHCEQCGHRHLSYNSCGNRHCSVCGKPGRREWLQRVMNWRLPTSYLHLVFTIPHELIPLVQANPRALYRLLLTASRQSLLKFAAGYDGAVPGIIQVLHTWGQRMNLHPHSHVLLTAGGVVVDRPAKKKTIRKQAREERQAREQQEREEQEQHQQQQEPSAAPAPPRWVAFDHTAPGLQPGPLGRAFRDAFVAGLRRLYRQGKLTVPDELGGQYGLLEWLAPLAGRYWHVHCQPPPSWARGPDAVLNYLSRYASGAVIHDARVLEDDGTHVTIRIKDYRDQDFETTRAVDTETMSGEEFVARYVQHILPRGFRRVGYSGMFAHGRRAELLRLARQALGVSTPEAPPDDATIDTPIPTTGPAPEDISRAAAALATVRDQAPGYETVQFDTITHNDSLPATATAGHISDSERVDEPAKTIDERLKDAPADPDAEHDASKDTARSKLRKYCPWCQQLSLVPKRHLSPWDADRLCKYLSWLTQALLTIIRTDDPPDCHRWERAWWNRDVWERAWRKPAPDWTSRLEQPLCWVLTTATVTPDLTVLPAPDT